MKTYEENLHIIESNYITKENGAEILLCIGEKEIDRYVLPADATPQQKKMWLKIIHKYNPSQVYDINEFDCEGRNNEEILTKGKIVNDKQY